MILAHLSDLHLGYGAYEPTGVGGPPREKDVARAFHSAVNEIVKIEPDVVLMAGDIFDRPQPPASALVTLARALAKLRSALPDTPVLMVAGARDTPRGWGDPGALAALDTFPNVEAATGTPRAVRLRGGDAHFFLLPHRSVLHEPHPEVRPDPGARWNVLLAYGAVAVTGGRDGEDDRGDGRVRNGGDRRRPLRISAADWDYVALGHHHSFGEVARRVVYSGSLERVGPEPWTEAHRSKGFAVVDLSSGQIRFREVAGRPVVALAPIRWDAARPDRTNQRIREVKDEVPGGMEGKIVRLRLDGMGSDQLSLLDGELLTDLRREAMDLSVEVGPTGDAGVEDRSLLGRIAEQLVAEGSEREALLADAESLLEALIEEGEPGPTDAGRGEAAGEHSP